MKLITFKTNKSGITINIPRVLLNHVAKNNPENPVRILDSEGLLNEVAYELEHNLGSDNESNAPTGFQELIDNAIFACIENGSESIELL